MTILPVVALWADLRSLRFVDGRKATLTQRTESRRVEHILRIVLGFEALPRQHRLKALHGVQLLATSQVDASESVRAGFLRAQSCRLSS